MGTRPKPIPDSPKEDSFMCGRYTLAKPLKTIESHFAPVHINLEYRPSYNIAPSGIPSCHHLFRAKGIDCYEMGPDTTMGKG